MKIKSLKKGFERLTIAKARIIAHSIGDGAVYKSNHDYNIKYEVKDIESLGSFERDMLKVYGLKLTKGFKPSGFTGEPIPFLRLRSKLVYEDLKKYATYKSKDWKIKKELLNSSKNIKREFLKALFDDEGGIFPKGDKGIIKLYSINKNGLKQVQGMLSEFKINSKLSSGYGAKRNVYAIIINDLSKFDKEVGFNLNRKQSKLNSLKLNV